MIGCEQTAAPESTVFATNVSGRVKAPDRIPRHSLPSLPALCPSFLPSFFPVLCLRFRYHQNSFRHSKFLLLYTPANNGDPARFLFPISLFPRSTYSPRLSDFRFCYRIQRSATPIFLFFAPFLYSFVLFPLLLVFGFSFVIFFALSQFLLILFFIPFHLLTSSVASFDSPRVYTSLPFFRAFSFIFFSHLLLPHLSNPLFRAPFLCLSLFCTHRSRSLQPLPLLRFIPLFLPSRYLL